MGERHNGPCVDRCAVVPACASDEEWGWHVTTQRIAMLLEGWLWLNERRRVA